MTNTVVDNPSSIIMPEKLSIFEISPVKNEDSTYERIRKFKKLMKNEYRTKSLKQVIDLYENLSAARGVENLLYDQIHFNYAISSPLINTLLLPHTLKYSDKISRERPMQTFNIKGNFSSYSHSGETSTVISSMVAVLYC